MSSFALFCLRNKCVLYIILSFVYDNTVMVFFLKQLISRLLHVIVCFSGMEETNPHFPR